MSAEYEDDEPPEDDEYVAAAPKPTFVPIIATPTQPVVPPALVASEMPTTPARVGRRSEYDALLAALEAFPTVRASVLQWAAETGKRPEDDIWEFVSAAFLAHTATVAAGGVTTLPPLIADAFARTTQRLDALAGRFDELAARPLVVPEDALTRAVVTAQQAALAAAPRGFGRREIGIAAGGITCGALMAIAVGRIAGAHAMPHGAGLDLWAFAFVGVAGAWLAASALLRRALPRVADSASAALALVVTLAVFAVAEHAR